MYTLEYPKIAVSCQMAPILANWVTVVIFHYIYMAIFKNKKKQKSTIMELTKSQINALRAIKVRFSENDLQNAKFLENFEKSAFLYAYQNKDAVFRMCRTFSDFTTGYRNVLGPIGYVFIFGLFKMEYLINIS